MKKTSKLLAVIFLLATVLLSAAACSAMIGPSFINPKNDDDDNQNEVLTHYVIYVKSESGLKLNGVTVTATDEDGNQTMGISKNGKVEFPSLPLGEYKLTFENLPNGYYQDIDETHVTNKTNYAYTAKFKSSVMENSATSNTRYSLYDVMHDFTITDVENNSYTLSKMLETYDAVVLNFFYKSCGPCRTEFPYLNKAAETFKDKLIVLALDKQDTVDEIQNFQENLGLDNLNMCYESGSLHTYFNVSSYPTTVIIDKSGVVVYIDSGSITNDESWNNLFSYYTSNKYDENDDENKIEETTRKEPTIDEPNYSDFSNIKSNNDFTTKFYASTKDDKNYSWPFLLGQDEDGYYYAYASNTNVELSFATLNIDITLAKDYALSFDYKCVSEAGYDRLYMLIDGELVTDSISGDTNGWKSANYVYVADDEVTITLTIVYNKDGANSVENEFAGIRNLTITYKGDITDSLDVRIDAATNKNANGKFDNYKKPMLNEQDGFYYVEHNDGKKSILLADFLNVSPWTKLHYGTDTIEKESEAAVNYGEYYRTPYYISFYSFGDMSGAGKYSDTNFVYYSYEEYKKNNSHNLVKVDYCDLVIDYFYMQEFSDNGYFPVTEETKALLQDFAFTFAYKNGWELLNDNMWLEFCYYYEHNGGEHTEGAVCNATNNPTLGMSPRNPIEITATAEEFEKGVTMAANNYRPMTMNRGVKYKLTAPKSGVYEIKSLYKGEEIDPMFYIMQYNEETKVYDIIYDVDDCLNYDTFTNNDYLGEGTGYGYNFVYNIYLEEGQTVYPTMAVGVGYTGIYDFKITYIGETARKLLVCTTGDGAWTYDDNGMRYLAVDVKYDEDNDCYRHVLADGNLGSPIYIDFIRPNFFDQNGHTIKDWIDAGEFNFGTKGDQTATMNEYYSKALENTGELYGMHIADKKLIKRLNYLMEKYGNDASTNAWRAMACYYEYYGPTIGDSVWDDLLP